MKNIGHIARLFVMVAAFSFALSIRPAFAAGEHEAVEPTHASAVGQVVSEAGHGAEQGLHGEEEGGSVGGAHAEGSLSPRKLKDLFWRIVNFAALMIILVKFGAKPIASGLSGRQKRIKDDLEELQRRRDEAENQYREFEAKLATVEQDIDGIVEKAVAQAEIEKAKIIEKAEKAVDDMKRQSELMIQNEIIEARRTLKNEIADQAAVMAEELIVKNLKAQDQVRIIENYLTKVEAVQ